MAMQRMMIAAVGLVAMLELARSLYAFSQAIP